MTIPSELDERIRKRAAELLGGEAEYQKIADQESKEALGRWKLDTELVGRILRAHLFLERFMTENLQRANPSLGPIEKAKLIFSQKIDLMNPNQPDVAHVTTGIRKLSSIRNRLAHQSDTEVTTENSAALLQCLARHASIALSVSHSRLIAALATATRELAPEQSRQG